MKDCYVPRFEIRDSRFVGEERSHDSRFTIYDSRALRHTRAHFKDQSVSAPAPRNYTKELQQILAGQQATAGGFYDLAAQYNPLYATLNNQITQTSNTSNRIANTSDLATIGPGVTGTILGNNPFLTDALLAGDSNLANASAGSPLLSKLNSQAEAGLDAGGKLTPEQQRDSDQAALAYFGGAGISNGNSAIASQLFNRQRTIDTRQQAAQQFAAGVQGLNTTQEGLVGNLAGAQGSLASSAITGPILQILGLGTLTPGQGVSGGGTGSNGSLVPDSGLANDIFSTNFNSAATTDIANANNNAASNAALLSVLGSLFGGGGYGYSDDRLKKGIRETGEATPEGVPIISFIYKTDKKKRRYTGVRASDVEKIRPDAVLTDEASGLRMVNYPALGVRSIQEQLFQKEAA